MMLGKYISIYFFFPHRSSRSGSSVKNPKMLIFTLKSFTDKLVVSSCTLTKNFQTILKQGKKKTSATVDDSIAKHYITSD